MDRVKKLDEVLLNGKLYTFDFRLNEVRFLVYAEVNNTKFACNRCFIPFNTDTGQRLLKKYYAIKGV
jgi:hypothetical protein